MSSGVNDPESLRITAASVPRFPGEKLVDLVGQNIALNKPTKQISTFSNDQSLFGASNAVDGNINTISHTSDPVPDTVAGGFEPAWWQVDLEYPFEITSIVIVLGEYEDCCQDRLNDFWIMLIDADGSTVVDEKYITTAVVSDNIGTFYNHWALNNQARYVRIYKPYKDDASSEEFNFLHLAEVRVYGNYMTITDPGDYCLTGQFDTQVAKEAMETCDTSMDLVLGSDMSLGTFIGIVNEVEEKGPDLMPGVYSNVCLVWFGILVLCSHAQTLPVSPTIQEHAVRILPLLRSILEYQ